MGSEPEKRSVLTAAEKAEVAAYRAAVEKGRMDFRSDNWTRYLKLVEVEESGDRSVLEKPVEAVAEKVRPVKKDEAYFARLYFPEAAELAGKTRISRLKKSAKDANQPPPPLEDPAAMLTWYEEMKAAGAWKKQSDLLQWLRRAAAMVAPATNVVPMPVPAAVPRVQVAPEDLQDPAQQLQHLEMEAQRLQIELTKAQETGESDASLDTRRNRWMEANIAAANLRTRLKKEGVLIAKEAATGAFQRILHQIPEAMVRELRKLLPDADEAVIRTAVRSAWAPAFTADLMTA